MRKRLIKLLGGYTADEWEVLQFANKVEAEMSDTLRIALAKAQKNDHRDAKGRFTKRPDVK